MKTDHKIYVFLCTLFSVLILTGNLIYQKFVLIPLWSFYNFEISAGAILYPLTFLLTDLIAEFYGKEEAKLCVKLSIIINSFIMIIILGLDALPAALWSRISNEEFHKMFGWSGLMFIGSTIACYIAQTVDIKVYLKIKQFTKDRLLWVRNILSTGISLCIDTGLVITFMVLLGILPLNKMKDLFINSYSFKLLFTLWNAPLFYLAFYMIKKIKNKDTYIETDFSEGKNKNVSSYSKT